MKQTLKSMTPEQRRAMLAHLLQKQPAVTTTALTLQALFLDCMSHRSPIWNMHSTNRIFQKVDPLVLQARWQKVIDRHPALRTTYEVTPERMDAFRARQSELTLGRARLHNVYQEGFVVQRVHEPATADFEVIDAREWGVAELRQRLVDETLRLMDPRLLPLCRLKLYQRQNEDIVQLVVHHCAADLWSLELMVEELQQPKEGPAPATFAEFCSWQRGWLALPKADEMRVWWKNYMDGCPPVPLPPNKADDAGETITFPVDHGVVEQARLLCRSHKITMFNMMLSVLQVCISRIQGVEDFAIAGATANRPNHHFEDSVGFFAQLAIYRQDLSKIQTWKQLWSANQATLSEILDRQFFPVTELPLPNTDFYISYHQYQRAKWTDQDAVVREDLGLRSSGVMDSALGPWELVFVEMPLCTSGIVFEVVDQRSGLSVNLRYRVTCLSKKRADLYVRLFQELLALSLSDCEATIDKSPVRVFGGRSA